MEVIVVQNATLLAVVAGFVRDVAGYLENALRDGKVEPYEVKKLAGTILAYIGTVNLLAIGLSPETATVVTVIVDMLRTGLAKLG